VSNDLFGELESIHVLHGPGEAHAHLEHLEAAGDVISDGTDYQLSEGATSELAEREDESWQLTL
jgi:hypothetical protein